MSGPDEAVTNGSHIEGSQSDDETVDTGRYLTGVRLTLAIIGLGITLFLPAAEITIVSTSLLTVSEDLDGFDRSSWVITAYLSNFTGFLLIWSKFSTSIGLKPALLGAMFLFLVFSAACGVSQTMTQLIIFRAFQGIAGSGAYSLPSIAFFQLVPPEKYNKINAVSSIIMASAIAISPLLGGGISQENAWRWIFYLNLPAGGLALLFLVLSLPARFPNHCEPVPDKKIVWSTKSDFFRKTDLIGAAILLGAIIFLVAALEEANVQFAWDSPLIISFLVIAAFLWICFAFWNWLVARINLGIEPIIPPHFLSNRCLMASLFGCLITGAPMTIASIELPQRFQLVNESSPLDAGVRLLFFALAMPIGIVVASALTGRLRLPFVFALIFGGCLQIAGFALLSTAPTSIQIWKGIYGYCVLAGLGVGVSAGTYYMMVPIACAKEDQHLALGLGLQTRMLGGAIGIAIANSVWVNYVRSHLASKLSTPEIDLVMTSIGSLSAFPTDLQDYIRRVCGEGYGLQMQATVGFSAAQVLVILALWRRRPYRLSKQGTLE